MSLCMKSSLFHCVISFHFIVTKDMEKTEVLNVFMPPSDFPAKVCPETLLAESVEVQHFPQQRKIQLGISSACWTHTHPWGGKRCTQRHRET